MGHSRRRFLCATVPGISFVSGCLSQPLSSDPQFRKGGAIRTDEPLLTDTAIKPQSSFPYQYSALITDKEDAERVRWEYFREEDPVFAEKFTGADFSQVFLTFAGIVLPQSADLESERSEFDEGLLESTYRIREQSDLSENTTIHTAVEYWDRDGKPPSKLAISYRF